MCVRAFVHKCTNAHWQDCKRVVNAAAREKLRIFEHHRAEGEGGVMI